MGFGKTLASLTFGLSLLLPTTLMAQEYDSLKTVQVANILSNKGFNLEGYIVGKPSQTQIDNNDSSVVINCPLVAEKQYNDTLMDYPIFIAFNKNDSTNRFNKDFINNYGGLGFIMDNNLIPPEAYADSIKGLLKKTITSVESNDGKILEEMLYEVYPNPSNGNVNIKYDIKNQSEVTINLYDILGRQLRTSSEQNPAGQYIKNFETSGLPSGIYFLQVIIDSNKKRLTNTKKVSLIK